MKVILLEDVRELGKKNDIVDVNNGYARNFLFPKKKAIEATASNLSLLKKRRAGEVKIAQEQKDAAEKLAQELAGKQVSIKMKAGEHGKLFGSISTKDIADAYMEQFELEIDRRKIQLSDVIRTFGVHAAIVKLHPEVSGDLSILIKET
jgi:large subunit ribosomal protein L9